MAVAFELVKVFLRKNLFVRVGSLLNKTCVIYDVYRVLKCSCPATFLFIIVTFLEADPGFFNGSIFKLKFIVSNVRSRNHIVSKYAMCPLMVKHFPQRSSAELAFLFESSTMFWYKNMTSNVGQVHLW